MRSFVIALVPISALLPSTVSAQARCGHPDPEISIGVCSGIIQSGRVKGHDLAVAHTERGIAYVTLLITIVPFWTLERPSASIRSFARAFANRGAVYGAKQDFEKALADFSRVLTLEPRSAHAFADRAGMHRLNGQDDAAIKDYTEAIRIDPAFADAILNRAITLAGTGKCAEALPDFTRAIELNPRDSIALLDRGLCYQKIERDDLALNDYSAHLDVEPRSQDGLELRGALYFRARQYERAGADFAQALVVNPSSATALYGRGMVKRMTGDARGGELDMETAKAMRAGVAEQSAARGVR